MTPTLPIGDLVLRPLSLDDSGRVYRLVNEWSIVRMLSSLPFPYTQDEAERWIKRTIDMSLAAKAWHFAIERKGELVGCIGITLEPSPRVARIGYWIGRAFWRMGIGLASVERVTQWAFDTLSIDKLMAEVAHDNDASAALLKNIGFRHFAVSKTKFLSRGGVVNTNLFEARSSFIARRHAPLSESTRNTVLVAAIALVDLEGRVLLAKRPAGKPLAGLWEFPGGKVEKGETPETALIREMREELGIDLLRSCFAPFTFISHETNAFHLLMMLYICRRWDGTLHAMENQELEWVLPSQMEAYSMPRADLPIIPLLREIL